MDPGAFALIGAASFMGGVTRLTLTVTVMMVVLFCFTSFSLFYLGVYWQPVCQQLGQFLVLDYVCCSSRIFLPWLE